MLRIKSIRLEESLIEDIENRATYNKIDFSKTVNRILKEYFQDRYRKQIAIGGIKYYPIHLTNDELIMIMNDFLLQYNERSNCLVKARKDSGGKGVDFQVNYYKEFKVKQMRYVRYTFSINPDWIITNTFKHTVNENNDPKHFLSEKINDLAVFTLDSIIDENIKKNNVPEENESFRDDNWKILFERKYPILKLR